MIEARTDRFEQAACCPIRPGRGTLGRPDACQRETNPVPSELCHPATSFPCKNKARDETDAPNASQEQRDKVLDAYDAMRPEFTDSNAFGRVALDIADGARFTALLRRYLDEQSPQRAPALFSSVRPLYASVPGAAEQCLAVMRGRLDGAASEKEKPWVHHFIAKHHDYFCETEAAFAAIEQAIALEPGEADFLLCKARLLKHAGDTTRAAEVVDTARAMEPSDRYLNNKAIKYMLRAHKPDVALSLANLFVRTDDKSPALVLAELHEMQCMWFEYESAHAALARGNVIECLKQCQWIERHFETFVDDMFDFHDFALRKMTLRSYMALQRNEARIRAAPMFRRMVALALQAIFRVHDQGAGKSELARLRKAEEAARKAAAEDADESRFAGMTPTEKKMAVAKLKKERLAKEQAAVAAAAAAQQQQSEDEAGKGGGAAGDLAAAMMSNQGRPRKRLDVAADADPQGVRHFEAVQADPLKYAQKLVDLLAADAPDAMEAAVARFDVAVRRRQLDVCVAAMETAVRANGGSFKHAQIAPRLLPLAFHAGQGGATTWRAKTATPVAIDDALASRLAVAPAQAEAAALELLRGPDARLAVAAGEALVAMDAAKHAAAVAQAIGSVVEPLELALAARDVLAGTGVGEAHAAKCAARWPLTGKLWQEAAKKAN